MTTTRHSRLIIIGSGPAGYSAAVYAARANRSPLLITGVEQGGQLMTTTEVDNWPGDVHGLQGPELMDRMRRHAERFNTQIVNDHIHTADLKSRPFRRPWSRSSSYRSRIGIGGADRDHARLWRAKQTPAQGFGEDGGTRTRTRERFRF